MSGQNPFGQRAVATVITQDEAGGSRVQLSAKSSGKTNTMGGLAMFLKNTDPDEIGAGFVRRIVFPKNLLRDNTMVLHDLFNIANHQEDYRSI